ncbi:hypothetical protein FQN55_006982 [Onygenales sp. PD_40]|nr:hypothetical protein FQN55_006982 [Onygenales sp. PD_40]
MDRITRSQVGKLTPSSALRSKVDRRVPISLRIAVTGSGLQSKVIPYAAKLEILRQWWAMMLPFMPHLSDLVENDFQELFNASAAPNNIRWLSQDYYMSRSPFNSFHLKWICGNSKPRYRSRNDEQYYSPPRPKGHL